MVLQGRGFAGDAVLQGFALHPLKKLLKKFLKNLQNFHGMGFATLGKLVQTHCFRRWIASESFTEFDRDSPFGQLVDCMGTS